MNIVNIGSSAQLVIDWLRENFGPLAAGSAKSACQKAIGEERAAVADYLRRCDDYGFRNLADAIERGEHLSAATTPQKE